MNSSSNKSLKIAMVAACPFPAAFASSGLIRESSLALVKRGHEVHVVTYHLGVDGFDTEGLNIHRIPPVSRYQKFCSGISLGKPFLDILLTFKLLKVAKLINADIIHAHNYEAPPAGYLVRRKLKIPVLYHAHNTMYHELPTYYKNQYVKKFAQFTGRKLDQWIPPRADRVLAVSEEQKDYLIAEGVSPSKITISPPGIFPESFQNADRNLIRTKLNLGEKPLIIYTGGLQPYQNCLALIEILRHLLCQIRDAHLLIVARSESEEFRSQAIAAGVSDRIHFLHGTGLEWEKNCLAAADVAVIPRLHCIGFPVKILNYMAASKPVVCFNSMIKTFKPNEEVMAIPNANYKAMAEGISELIRNPEYAKKLAEKGRQAVYEHHHWDNIAARIESIYIKMI